MRSRLSHVGKWKGFPELSPHSIPWQKILIMPHWSFLCVTDSLNFKPNFYTICYDGISDNQLLAWNPVLYLSNSQLNHSEVICQWCMFSKAMSWQHLVNFIWHCNNINNMKIVVGEQDRAMARNDEVSDHTASPKSATTLPSALALDINQTQSDTEVVLNTQRQYEDDAWEESEPVPTTNQGQAQRLPDSQNSRNRYWLAALLC